MVNVYKDELKYFQVKNLSERELVASVVNHPRHADGGSKGGVPNNAAFAQVVASRIEDGRVSRDGVLMLRAYAAGGAPIPIADLGDLKIQVGTKQLQLETGQVGSEASIVPLDAAIGEARFGDHVEFRLTLGDTQVGSRYSWYRPRTGWVVDYSVLGLAFSWPTWRFEGKPESAVVPAMVHSQYRYYRPNGGFYVFGGIAVGPNLVLDEARLGGTDRSGGDAINGLVAAATLNINGFQLGLGARWAWSEGRVDPMLMISVTEALARGLGITDAVPSQLLGGDP